MDDIFEKKIFQWIKLEQNKYKKFYRIDKTRIFQNESNELFFEENVLSKKNSRKTLGSLKFLPISIFFYIRNLPSPWDAEIFSNVLVHKNKMLYIITDKNKNLDLLYFSQWILLNRLLSKIKSNPLNYRKLNLSFFDSDIKKKYKTIFPETNDKKLVKFQKLNIAVFRNNFFYMGNDLSSFLKNKSYKKFFLDLPYLISINELSLLGSNQQETKFITSNLGIFKSYNLKNCLTKLNSNDKKKQTCFQNTIDFPFLYKNLALPKKKKVDFTDSIYFSSMAKKKIDYSKKIEVSKFALLMKNIINYNSEIKGKFNKNSIFYNYTPFFQDLFLVKNEFRCFFIC